MVITYDIYNFFVLETFNILFGGYFEAVKISVNHGSALCYKILDANVVPFMHPFIMIYSLLVHD